MRPPEEVLLRAEADLRCSPDARYPLVTDPLTPPQGGGARLLGGTMWTTATVLEIHASDDHTIVLHRWRWTRLHTFVLTWRAEEPYEAAERDVAAAERIRKHWRWLVDNYTARLADSENRSPEGDPDGGPCQWGTKEQDRRDLQMFTAYEQRAIEHRDKALATMRRLEGEVELLA